MATEVRNGGKNAWFGEINDAEKAGKALKKSRAELKASTERAKETDQRASRVAKGSIWNLGVLAIVACVSLYTLSQVTNITNSVVNELAPTFEEAQRINATFAEAVINATKTFIGN